MPNYVVMPRILINAASEQEAAKIMEDMLNTLYSHPNFIDYAAEDNKGLIAKETELSSLNHYFLENNSTEDNELNCIFRNDKNSFNLKFTDEQSKDIRSELLAAVSHNGGLAKLYDANIIEFDDDLTNPYEMADRLKKKLATACFDYLLSNVDDFMDHFVASHYDEIESFLESKLLNKNIHQQDDSSSLNF